MRWVYSKDDSFSGNEDKAFIQYINFIGSFDSTNGLVRERERERERERDKHRERLCLCIRFQRLSTLFFFFLFWRLSQPHPSFNHAHSKRRPAATAAPWARWRQATARPAASPATGLSTSPTPAWTSALGCGVSVFGVERARLCLSLSALVEEFCLHFLFYRCTSTRSHTTRRCKPCPPATMSAPGSTICVTMPNCTSDDYYRVRPPISSCTLEVCAGRPDVCGVDCCLDLQSCLSRLCQCSIESLISHPTWLPLHSKRQNGVWMSTHTYNWSTVTADGVARCVHRRFSLAPRLCSFSYTCQALSCSQTVV
jgi:hypothetical protein